MDSLLKRNGPLVKVGTSDNDAEGTAIKGVNLDFRSKVYSHHGSKQRDYRVYRPSTCKGKKKRPLVLVLHGCQQTHLDIQMVTNFDALAERYGFFVAYPFVTRYHDLRLQNCWGWWRPDQTRPGKGEVEDLSKIVDEVCTEFPIDETRIHIAGLSSGAAMTVAALVVHENRFASGGAVAGVAYGERIGAVMMPKARRFRPVEESVELVRRVRAKTDIAPLCIVHSQQDSVVHMQAAENLRDAWLQLGKLSSKSIRSVSHKHSNGTRYAHTRYGKRFAPSVLETIFLEGPDHGWYGGKEGKFGFSEGPDVSSLMWKFFRQHRAPQR